MFLSKIRSFITTNDYFCTKQFSLLISRTQMPKEIDFSLIIPHSNSLQLLPRLLHSIPLSDKIEVLIVDNSPIPITKSDIGVERDYTLLYSSPKKGAGGARNKGIDFAKGKWLVFIDADDYLSEKAFDIFYSHLNDDAEIIYFCSDCIFSDTQEHSDRSNIFNQMVKDYLTGDIPEEKIRTHFFTPWPKMVSHALVNRYELKFDEVIASNDVYFSLLSGFYANSIKAVNEIVYIATVNKGSLTMRHDSAVILARFEVYLRFNRFVREHGLSKYQRSIMYLLFRALKCNFRTFFICLGMIFRYKQNPFIGATKWWEAALNIQKRNQRYQKYITQ